MKISTGLCRLLTRAAVKESPALRGLLVLLAQRDRRALKVTQGLKVLLGLKVTPALRGLPVLPIRFLPLLQERLVALGSLLRWLRLLPIL